MGISISLLALLGIAGFLFTLKSEGEKPKDTTIAGTRIVPVTHEAQVMTLDDLYQKWGTQSGLDWRLLKAIARVESSENPNAVNPADPSTGLMQILCRPGEGGFCTNRFNIDGWPVTKNQLFDPDTNLKMGSQILSWNIRRYGFKRGIAVYNRWASRHDPENGPFGNQEYVNRVLGEYVGLGGHVPT